jgi:hypothetical protein
MHLIRMEEIGARAALFQLLFRGAAHPDSAAAGSAG